MEENIFSLTKSIFIITEMNFNVTEMFLVKVKIKFVQLKIGQLWQQRNAIAAVGREFTRQTTSHPWSVHIILN